MYLVYGKAKKRTLILPFCFSYHQEQLHLKLTKGLKHYRSIQLAMYPKGSIKSKSYANATN